MKRYIRTAFLLTFLITIVVVLAASYTLFAQERTREARQTLLSIAEAVRVSELPPGVDLTQYAHSLGGSVPSLRVSILDRSGTVLSDSEVDAQTLPSHADRKEFRESLTKSYGEDIRVSETTGVKTLYVAMAVDATHVLRLSLPISGMLDFVSAMLPTTLLLCLILFLFVYVFSERLSMRLVRSYERITDSLGHLANSKHYLSPIDDSAEFPELSPALRSIRSIGEKLQENLQEIDAKKNELDNILKTATDGIVLLSRDERVVSINDAAKRILSAPPDESAFRNICRYGELYQQVQQALETGSPCLWEMDLSATRGRYYRAFINPAKNAGVVTGAVIFLSDVTELVKLERMRSEFVANVSHELKSPLTSIKGFAELMSAGLVSDPDQQADYLKRIVVESERLLSIINDILHLSELESIKAEPVHFQKVSLEKLAADSAQALQARIQEKQMALSITGEGAIFAEREPLYELVYNLIENAAKYGKEGGHIQVNVEETSDEVRLSVRDDGPGIAPEHLPRIFERFYRTDRSRNRKSQSTGLGLAIVKHTAQRYHGTVRAESELGKYTEFTVIFPKQ